MKLSRQVELGYIRCPSTLKILKLSSDNKYLFSDESQKKYLFNSYGSPILIEDDQKIKDYLSKSESMINEYTKISVKSSNLWKSFKELLSYDFRTNASKEALKKSISSFSKETLGLNIGGGPSRINDWLTNVNIAPFINIDVVADAHNLPYIDQCVDFVYCEAVFEHLHSPTDAAKEIYRILKKEGRAYIITPFMQTYHGYPDHYQNLTISGHKKLFENAGFKVIESGTCVGPLYALMNTTTAFIKHYIPFPFNYIFRILWAGAEIVLRPLDLYFGNKSNSYILASSTYVSLEK